MDAIRLGLQLRALRIRRRRRQVDVALRAVVSRGTISNLERGGLRGVSVETLVRVAAVLGADVDIRIRWHGSSSIGCWTRTTRASPTRSSRS